MDKFLKICLCILAGAAALIMLMLLLYVLAAVVCGFLAASSV